MYRVIKGLRFFFVHRWWSQRCQSYCLHFSDLFRKIVVQWDCTGMWYSSFVFYIASAIRIVWRNLDIFSPIVIVSAAKTLILLDHLYLTLCSSHFVVERLDFKCNLKLFVIFCWTTLYLVAFFLKYYIEKSSFFFKQFLFLQKCLFLQNSTLEYLFVLN